MARTSTTSISTGSGSKKKAPFAPEQHDIRTYEKKLPKHEVKQCSLPASKLPLLVLHVHCDESLDTFPETVNAPVNMRSQIQVAKLNSDSDSNIYRAFVNTELDEPKSVISGEVTVTVGSFALIVAQDDGRVPLSSTSNAGGNSKNLVASDATPEMVREALSWIMGEEHTPISSVSVGIVRYFAELMKLHAPNGSSDVLEKFIRDRTWNAPENRLWGESKERVLKWAAGGEMSAKNRNRILHRFISENFAWQTKLVMFVSDGLHRIAVADSAPLGLIPRGCSADFKVTAQKFMNKLTHAVDPCGGSRWALSDPEGKTTDIDTMLTISCCIPVSNIDTDFCLRMKGRSAQAQLGQGRAEDHTMRNVMSFVLHQMSEFPYLMNVLPQVWAIGLTGDKKQLLKLIREGGLSVLDQDVDVQCVVPSNKNTKEEKKREEENKKKPDLGDNNKKPDLGEICIRVWIDCFAKWLLPELRRIMVLLPEMCDIDDQIGLQLLLKKDEDDAMGEELFKTLFHKKKDAERYSAKGAPCIIPFSNAPCMLSSLFSPKAVTNKVKDPYELYDRTLDNRGTKIPHSLLDFVWILMWSHVSKSIDVRMRQFVGSTVDPIYPQCGVGTKEQCRQYFHLFVQTVGCTTASLTTSWWNGTYFKRVKKPTPCKTLGRDGISVLLLDGILEDCQTTFGRFGIAPKRYDLNDPAPPFNTGHIFQQIQQFEKVTSTTEWKAACEMGKSTLFMMIGIFLCKFMSMDDETVLANKIDLGKEGDQMIVLNQITPTPGAIFVGSVSVGGPETQDLRSARRPGNPSLIKPMRRHSIREFYAQCRDPSECFYKKWPSAAFHHITEKLEKRVEREKQARAERKKKQVGKRKIPPEEIVPVIQLGGDSRNHGAEADCNIARAGVDNRDDNSGTNGSGHGDATLNNEDTGVQPMEDTGKKENKKSKKNPPKKARSTSTTAAINAKKNENGHSIKKLRRKRAKITKGVVTTLKPYINLFAAEDEEVEGVIGFDAFIALIKNDEEKAEEFWRKGIAPILSNYLGFFHQDQERTNVVKNVVGGSGLNESKSSNGGEDGKEDLTHNPNPKGGEDGKEEEEEEDGRQCIEFESKCRGGSEDEEEDEVEEEADNTSIIADTEEEDDDTQTELERGHHAQLAKLGDNERAGKLLGRGGASTSQSGSDDDDSSSSSSGTTQHSQDESESSDPGSARDSARATTQASTQASTQVPAHGNIALDDGIDFSGGNEYTPTPAPAPAPAQGNDLLGQASAVAVPAQGVAQTSAQGPVSNLPGYVNHVSGSDNMPTVEGDETAPASALALARDNDLLGKDSTLAGPAQGKAPTGYGDNATDLGVGNDVVNGFIHTVPPPLSEASFNFSEPDEN